MATPPESIESGNISGPPVDGKHSIDSEIASVDDSFQEDEALELVGKERTRKFTEEYNCRLRRKLVSDLSPWYSVHNLISVVGRPVCAAVCFTQFLCIGSNLPAQLTHFVQ